MLGSQNSPSDPFCQLKGLIFTQSALVQTAGMCTCPRVQQQSGVLKARCTPSEGDIGESLDPESLLGCPGHGRAHPQPHCTAQPSCRKGFFHMKTQAGCCRAASRSRHSELSAISPNALARFLAFYFFIHAVGKQNQPAPLCIIYSELDQRNSLRGRFGHFFLTFFLFFRNIYLFSPPLPPLPVTHALPIVFFHEQTINYSPAHTRQVLFRIGNQTSPIPSRGGNSGGVQGMILGLHALCGGELRGSVPCRLSKDMSLCEEIRVFLAAGPWGST